MDPVANPYAPGAGRQPAALVGRDREREAWRIALDRVQRDRTAQPIVLYGLRGVGKTVLLAGFTRAARERDWVVVQVEAAAGRPLREAIGEALQGPLADIARPNAGKRLLRALKTASTFRTSYHVDGSFSFGLDLKEVPGGGADTGVLETDLVKVIRDVSSGAAEEGVGLAILIDEAQDLSSDELVAVCAAAHLAGQENWHVVFALAGLPSLPRILAEAKSYAERLFTYEPIQQLSGDLARTALSEPAAAEGVAWDADALTLVVQGTSGYPYFLQQFGQEAWNAAAGPTITTSDAQLGVARGQAALDTGFFRARWDRATPAEQRYLRAIAIDGDAGSQSGVLAARLSRSRQSFGPARASLIAKGLIYAPTHGVVAFTVPGMAEFIVRQPEA